MSRTQALIILASGLSSRFGDTNKLLAKLHGLPLAAYSALLWRRRPNVVRIAVVAQGATEIASIYANNGCEVALNPAPDSGQSSSLRLGLELAQAQKPSAVLIALADMPLIMNVHLDALYAELGEYDAVMSESENVLMPPAIFSEHALPQLAHLQGDQGARRVFNDLSNTTTLTLPKGAARDVDTPAMLAQLHIEGSPA